MDETTGVGIRSWNLENMNQLTSIPEVVPNA